MPGCVASPQEVAIRGQALSRTPLTAVHPTIPLRTLASTGLLLALAFALPVPGPSRAALAPQADAPAALGPAAPWRPPRRLSVPAPPAAATDWDPAPPPARPPVDRVHRPLPLLVSAVVRSDPPPRPAATPPRSGRAQARTRRQGSPGSAPPPPGPAQA